MMVDRGELQKLFKSRKKNNEKIRELLYEICSLVTVDHDQRQSIWIYLDEHIVHYDRKKGEAFSYFYGLSQQWLKRSPFWKHKKHQDTFLNTSQSFEDEPQRLVRFFDYDRYVRGVQKTDDLQKYLDSLIRAARREVSKVAKMTSPRWGTCAEESDCSDPDYIFLTTGIHWLQSLRKGIKGEYLPLKLPHAIYQGVMYLPQIPIS